MKKRSDQNTHTSAISPVAAFNSLGPQNCFAIFGECHNIPNINHVITFSLPNKCDQNTYTTSPLLPPQYQVVAAINNAQYNMHTLSSILNK